MSEMTQTGTPAAAPGAAGGTTNRFTWNRATALFRRGEILLALGMMAVLTVLILPMPAWLLDISLALSITISVLILMVVLLIERPLEFSTFPTVLLIVTMLR
ncbi:MAG: FHIPEP family type III secretion protein, partial [Dongia sp.]